MIRVHRCHLLAPTEGADLVEAQMRAAHAYRNSLVEIERGRRHAIRALHATDEVRAAEDLLRAATKTERTAAKRALNAARRASEVDHADAMARIRELDEEIRRMARAHTEAYWGSYLLIEASHQQVRRMPLYEPDALTPSDPRFVRWTGDGQIGAQLQGGMSTGELLAGGDTRARVTGLRGADGYGQLAIRVGSDGRAPVWAVFPLRSWRPIPEGRVTWVRVSRSIRGPMSSHSSTRWSCEITVESGARPARDLDTTMTGVIAVNLCWCPQDDGRMLVARWRDDSGDTGRVYLPESVTVRQSKAESIRSIRDKLRNDTIPQIQRALRESTDPMPRWLRDAGDTVHLWKSSGRLSDLARRWRRERYDGARSAYEILDAFQMRDDHLWDYERGARSGALGQRKDIYRCLAKEWAGKYAICAVPDRDLSREARFGADSDARFAASPQELRDCLRAAFVSDCLDVEWPSKDVDGDEDSVASRWLDAACERARDAQMGRPARIEADASKSKEKGGAWARRKAKKKEALVGSDGQRSQAAQ